MYTQLVGTAMGHIFAPPYACLTIGYLEEEILFKTELAYHFQETDITKIQDSFKRYMDDGSTILPPSMDCNTFLNCLNNLHPSIEYTLEAATKTEVDNECIQVLNFLDITVILHADGSIETDIHYKPTNSHKYLNYNSFHPTHCKDNIPFALAKRIIVFVKKDEKVVVRLSELKSWLLQCGYPTNVVNKGIHNAKLQGPAPKPKNSKNTIPFVTTLMSNFDAKPLMNSILLSTTKSKHLQEVLRDVEIVGGFKQPKNLRDLLVHAKFGNYQQPINNLHTPGIFASCSDQRCKLCISGYMQNCNSFETAKGTIWTIKSHITCNSSNVLYYLKCNMCKGKTTYTGKTKTNLRIRMNNHITSCRSGNGTNMFDGHVFKCGKLNKCLKAPYFQIYAFMKVSTEEKLLTYERYLHRMGFDTMNK